jgi:predicted O-methyltransferase YrrM
MNPPGEMVLAPASFAARAMRMKESQIKPLRESGALRKLLGPAVSAKKTVSWKTLFHLQGKPLPCLMKEDFSESDPWLTTADYYPAYHSLFRSLSAGKKRIRFLEIGVRTGYVAAVLAQAVKCPAMYVGVDPNRYVSNGLELAGATLGRLRGRFSGFDGVLIEGYSWEDRIHHTLRDSGPFDWIHIDGHHVLDVKLHDIELARKVLAPGGLVLVDDLDHMDCVSGAVKRAMSLKFFREYYRYPTFRGLAVLRG